MVKVITIDGPSGAGKGTLCQLLAKQLGYHLLDSGALYRLTALSAEKQDVPFDDTEGLARVAASLDVEFRPVEKGVQVILAGEDVSSAIRQEHVGMNASKVAACQPVRDALLQRQRGFAEAPGLIADGRDMGTVVFPEAKVKVFLTASADERARRRVMQLEQAGLDADYAQILQDIELRDKQDRERKSSPLKPAEDAVVLDSTSLTIQQVLDRVIALT
ncbi:(d)CMP kinase [Aestuariicella hydrocarbonica]|uniref:Cytidylate kinase n=1 Tax=Pseudomaricurvus hydrocarbonicus TaxID=1470433 RepID=A0A9E5MJ42_9GAMM|nr:(d)CMP kinase [Aestuariicella hydrocarbonica]NHO64479.1 (d)CMP kinase [Aestuariicella hydrocarbonica]